ncbi:WhiB family transcriptional regulator [Nonomuraea diastatica]|uniref:WhiB family transcriptional regulator n=1 Tax=Nonomuraea diastatica TaxID=1848329 RepID=A0A4R4WHM6_9ACTN|nr:WhiB family transcriptional regulator [Nonomuraea diastatica]TDD17861.1 WhiB family transcriptional regulator [Nonomuraea diastatica]
MSADLPGKRPALALLAAVTAGTPRHLADEAACRFDPELHTGPDAFADEPADERAAREQVAREVCAGCPVWASCLFSALDMRPASGIWAGLTPEELREMAAPVSPDAVRGVA